MGLYAIQLSAEVSAVLRLEWTKYCPMISVWDLLVTFHWRWVYNFLPTSHAAELIFWTDRTQTRLTKSISGIDLNFPSNPSPPGSVILMSMSQTKNILVDGGHLYVNVLAKCDSDELCFLVTALIALENMISSMARLLGINQIGKI